MLFSTVVVDPYLKGKEFLESLIRLNIHHARNISNLSIKVLTLHFIMGKASESSGHLTVSNNQHLQSLNTKGLIDEFWPF